MKIGFVVNDIATEKAEYTTNRLAMAAKEMGHEAWYMGIGDFAYEPDGSLSTKARAGHAKCQREHTEPDRRIGDRPEDAGLPRGEDVAAGEGAVDVAEQHCVGVLGDVHRERLIRDVAEIERTRCGGLGAASAFRCCSRTRA